MEKIRKLFSKIENARMRIEPIKESKYRAQLEKLLANISSELEKETIGKLWNEMDTRTLNHLKDHLNAYQTSTNAKIIVGEKVYDMKHWCTISQYAKIHGYKNTMAVSNKMRRGSISSENIAYIPELDMKLIRI